jgi:putative tributyrin esterase
MRNNQSVRADKSVKKTKQHKTSETRKPAKQILKSAARPLATPRPSVMIEDRSFQSAALGRRAPYRVLLPAGYSASTKRYPVLFLLHGVFGGFENWETLTDLSRYAAEVELIIVTPDAANSWYVNSATASSERYEDFVIVDLLPEIDREWRTLRSSHRRAIAGLSMGGYGALKFAMKYPGQFAFAGSISGAFNGPLDLDELRADLRDDLRKAYGDNGSKTRRENDIFAILATADLNALPYFYMDCGASDDFCAVNRQFAEKLCERRAHYEYHEVPGEHSWKYWDQRIRVLLPIIQKAVTDD